MTQVYQPSDHSPQGEINGFEQPQTGWSTYAEREVAESLYPIADTNAPLAGVSGELPGDHPEDEGEHADADVDQTVSIPDNDGWTGIFDAYQLRERESTSRVGTAAVKLARIPTL